MKFWWTKLFADRWRIQDVDENSSLDRNFLQVQWYTYYTRALRLVLQVLRHFREGNFARWQVFEYHQHPLPFASGFLKNPKPGAWCIQQHFICRKYVKICTISATKCTFVIPNRWHAFFTRFRRVSYLSTAMISPEFFHQLSDKCCFPAAQTEIDDAFSGFGWVRERGYGTLILNRKYPCLKSPNRRCQPYVVHGQRNRDIETEYIESDVCPATRKNKSNPLSSDWS